MRDLPDLAPLIDHALLDPHQGQEAVLRCCDEARHFGFAGVCLGSRWLPVARERLGPSGGRGPRLISVVGFPFGAVPAAVKLAEAEWAAAAGAEELDVVPDFGALADGDSRSFCDDLAPIVELGLPVKVILEVGRLEPAALELAVEASIDVGAAVLKTGSGFGPAATVQQVQRLRDLARGRAAIKASGGITTLEQALDLVEAGASRLGTSRGVALIQALRRGGARQPVSADQRLEALVLRSSPLGESDRLLTVLSAAEGLTRLAAPGARKPKSSLAAAVPLALLSLQVGGRSGLRRVRQLRVVRNYSALAERLETLAAAQGLAELSLELVPTGAAVEGVLDDLLLQLNRLELVVKERQGSLEALAIAVQGAVHLLALGGYALPLASCARSGAPLEPPLGNWEWRCSLLPAEGFVIGAVAGAQMVLNASELALLQRLLRPALPRKRDGALMGPEPVWLRLLQLQELWGREHLSRGARSWRLLRQCYGDGASS